MNNLDKLEVLRFELGPIFGQVAACIEEAQKSLNPMVAGEADRLASQYSHVLPHLKKAEKAPTKLKDALIAKWAEAQIFAIDAEGFAAEQNEEIAQDASDGLDKAIDVLREFNEEGMDSMRPESQQLYSAIAPGEEVLFGRLLMSEEVLEICQSEMRSGLEL